MEVRDRVHEDLGEGTWNLEVIRIFQLVILCIILASKASKKKYNIRQKQPLDPSPTNQTSTQDPTSDKSQRGSGRPPPRLWIRACTLSNNVWRICRNPASLSVCLCVRSHLVQAKASISLVGSG